MTDNDRSHSRILVVDDELVVVSLVKEALEEDGYTLSMATNGREALALMEAQEFDLIISDIRMPKMDGIELVSRARKIQPGISIIFMTAFANLDSAKDAIKQGAVDYIMKPFELHEMRQAVQQAFALREQAAKSDSDSHLEHLSDLNQVLYEVGDKRSLLIESLRFALVHSDADRGVVLHWSKDNSDFQVFAIVDESVADRQVPDEQISAALADLNPGEFNEPLLTASFEEHPLHRMAQTCPAAGDIYKEWFSHVAQTATVPIKRADRLYGLLIIQLGDSSSASVKASLKLLNLSAAQLAISLENLELLDETQAAYQRLKALQDETIQLEKMATKGEMSAEIGHELNNFLGVVAGNLSLLQHQVSKNSIEGLDKYLRAIEENVDKIKTFTSNLMDLRSISTSKEVLCFARLLTEVVDYLRPQKRFKGVTLELRELPESIPFEADNTHIQQLLYNLFNNAADATRDCEHREISAQVELEPNGQQFSFSITDTGSGIEPALLEKAFNERFTTKKDGHGYGLVVCKRIIDSHQGVLHINSAVGRGTTIRIDFPLASPVPQSVPASVAG
jgi:signal transduction histidine kinase/CheY-like chemotaxis protein